MSEVFERAKAHFASLSRFSEHVPEWECTVYWRQWTGNERQKMFNAVKSSGREMELHPRAIIMKAEDEKGEKLFKIDDLPQFMIAVDPSVYDRLGAKIWATGNFDREQAEKN